jgi:hypothetical protein
MQHPLPPLRYLCAVTVLAFLLCTGITGAAPSDHPVVNGISGPDHLNDWYGPTGSYTFKATVSGGTPPYSYKWMNPPGMKTLYQGTQYGTVEIPATQLGVSGAGNYGIWLTVTDSQGRDAVWQRQGTSGNSNEFGYFLTTDGKTWSKKTEPATFPEAAAAPEAIETTNENCQDSGARFTGLSGDIMVFSECTGGNIKDPNAWVYAKRELVLHVGDHIRTGEDSQAILGFADMSTFILKQESEIVLASPPDRDSKVRLVLGNIWTNVKKMVKDGSMEVDMEQAVLGTKGTTFVCSSDGKTSTMQIIEGKVEITSIADGKKILVSGGQQVTATDKGLGTPVAFNTTAVQADWDTVKAQALSGTPASGSASAKKSGIESLLVPAALCIAAAGIALRRE